MRENHDQADAYQRQAQADREIAEILISLNGSGRGISRADSYSPHVIMMCQQAVEKSAKSLYILFGNQPKRTHQVEHYMVTIVQEPWCLRYGAVVRGQLSKLFTPETREVIRSLYALTPKSTQMDPGQTHRNTEYPFIKRGRWLAPCDASVFSEKEMMDIVIKTRRFVDGVERLRAAIRRR